MWWILAIGGSGSSDYKYPTPISAYLLPLIIKNSLRDLSQIDVLLLDKHGKILLKVIHRSLVFF